MPGKKHLYVTRHPGADSVPHLAGEQEPIVLRSVDGDRRLEEPTREDRLLVIEMDGQAEEGTYNKGAPRKVLLFLSDEDLRLMVEMKRLGVRHPVDHLQRVYRAFIQSIE